MKILFTALFTFIISTVWAQKDTAAPAPVVPHATYELHTTMATAAIGFIDGYRNSYSLPSGFQKNNTSGFAPILLKLEYAFGRDISLAATFGYDAFNYNFSQFYQGYNGTFVRYHTDDFRSVSGGITAYYHLRKIIHVNHLDPFVGIGLCLNNIRYSAYPSDDTLAIKSTHTVTPYIKVGARYYISSAFSIFADLGYDKPSVFSIGFSARFFPGKKPLK